MNAAVQQIERTTIHICRECLQTATVMQQPSLVPGRKLTQLECHTPGCPNWMQTVYERDVEQVAALFMTVGIDAGEMPRLVEGIEILGVG